VVNLKRIAIKTTIVIAEIILASQVVIWSLLLFHLFMEFLFPQQYLWLFKTFGEPINPYVSGFSCNGLQFFEPNLNRPFGSSEPLATFYCIDGIKVLFLIAAITLVPTILFEEMVRKKYLKIAQV
jgi:hypothetical protein